MRRGEVIEVLEIGELTVADVAGERAAQPSGAGRSSDAGRTGDEVHVVRG